MKPDGSSWKPGLNRSQQVDYRLMGSAIARVRWELDLNRRWERDPSFYLDQTLTALLEALVQPPPFDANRSREIVERMEEIPEIIDRVGEIIFIRFVHSHNWPSPISADSAQADAVSKPRLAPMLHGDSGTLRSSSSRPKRQLPRWSLISRGCEQESG